MTVFASSLFSACACFELLFMIMLLITIDLFNYHAVICSCKVNLNYVHITISRNRAVCDAF